MVWIEIVKRKVYDGIVKIIKIEWPAGASP